VAKQASVQETVGTAGQSRAEAQFNELNWGVAFNPYHDLGTDLWLMARDDRRFDLGLLLGAQVKTSETRSAASKYFKEPKREHGKSAGWWYRESLPEDHFDYWIKHSIPHILVAHDLKDRKRSPHPCARSTALPLSTEPNSRSKSSTSNSVSSFRARSMCGAMPGPNSCRSWTSDRVAQDRLHHQRDRVDKLPAAQNHQDPQLFSR
jgi:Domain of unknown function (DUF4365)